MVEAAFLTPPRRATQIVTKRANAANRTSKICGASYWPISVLVMPSWLAKMKTASSISKMPRTEEESGDTGFVIRHRYPSCTPQTIVEAAQLQCGKRKAGKQPAGRTGFSSDYCGVSSKAPRHMPIVNGFQNLPTILPSVTFPLNDQALR